MANLPCPLELWPTFSALLDEVLEVPLTKRAAWISRLGPEYAEVLPWLHKVVGPDGELHDTEFLRSPGGTHRYVDSDFAAGQAVGPYRLERLLGRGGMGEVWLASRDDGAMNRRVALKLPHRHLLADALRRRFERERDILAALSHVHIALLYDAGVDDSNHPYLAMEWVDGVSVVEFCHDEKIDLDGRLDLFLQILDAVAYAHGRLIAHRDLKPSNILVTAQRQVKLLDFGIAKLLSGQTDSGASQLTQAGGRMATPDYAAPEQLAGEPISAAADLYALGVVFYEVLTGARPRPGRVNDGVGGMPRASTHIVPDHAARYGDLTGKQLRRALSGDLDAILAKALEADPLRRYRSAEAFAQDITRSREHRPISARRVNAATLSAKFVRRHWLGVVMSLGLLVALLGGSLGVAWQALRAERAAQRATIIKDFLVDVFRASDPRIAGDKPRGEITARELLDVSADRVESGFANEPATEIELLGVTADIYRELDETQRSSALYARESALARSYYGESDAHAIDGLLGQANNAQVNGDNAHALALLAQADPLITTARLDESVWRARWLKLKGEALAGTAADVPEAQRTLGVAAALFAARAPTDPAYPDVLIDLGALALESSQFAQSARYYRESVAVAQRLRQSGGYLMQGNMGLALALKDLGDFVNASAAFASGVAAAEHTYGRDSHNYWAITSDWAKFRYERGEREAALAAFETLIDRLPEARAGYRNGSDAAEAAQALRKFGRCLAVDGQGARAIDLLERAQRLLKSSASHAMDELHYQFELAQAYETGGRMADARAAYTAALQGYELRGAAASQIAIVRERWGRFLLVQKELDGAQSAFADALSVSDGHVTEAALFAQAGLAAVALERADVRAALVHSGSALEQLMRIEGYYDIRLQPYIWAIRARALELSGAAAGARAFAQHAREADRRYYAPERAERLAAGITPR